MRNIVLSVLLLPAVAFGQQPVVVEKPVVCGPTKEILKSLTGPDFQEMPRWTGKDDDSKYSLFANEKTGGWTFIQFNEKIACVLGAGDDHRILRNKSITGNYR